MTTSLKRRSERKGIYLIRRPMDNMHLRVSIKPTKLITSLPKSIYNPDDPEIIHQSQMIEEYIFKWQGTKWNIYGRSKNPVTAQFWWMRNLEQQEMQYCEILKEGVAPTSKLFAHNQNDKPLVLPDTCINKFAKQFVCYDYDAESMKANYSLRSLMGRKPSKSQKLVETDENVDISEDNFINMHIMFDNSEYFEDPPEMNARPLTCLVCLCYNKKQKILMVSPDVNDLDMNPYEVETVTGEHWGYQYSINIVFDDGPIGLPVMLRNLQDRWNKRNKHVVYFAGPPIEMKTINLTFEIISFEDFEYNSLFVEYHIRLGEVLHCDDPLNGRTHKNLAQKIDGKYTFNVGHVFELKLTCLQSIEPPPIQIVLEVESSDYVDNYRTEGYGTLNIPLTPGNAKETLTTIIPEDLDRSAGMSRRYFVGGCHLVKDNALLDNPQTTEADYSNEEGGKVHVRWHIETQMVPGLRTVPLASVGSAPAAIFQGADIALMRYRLAKAKLLAATMTDETNEGASQSSKDKEE